MKAEKVFSKTAHREAKIDVDALLAAINEISEGEAKHTDNEHAPQRISVDGRTRHSYTELADAFELDIHDFSVSEVNR